MTEVAVADALGAPEGDHADARALEHREVFLAQRRDQRPLPLRT